jgi:hypothetical protein
MTLPLYPFLAMSQRTFFVFLRREKMKTIKFSIRVLAEIAIFAAIAYVLDLFQGIWFQGVWPNGGSIGIAMVPIFVIAYR